MFIAKAWAKEWTEQWRSSSEAAKMFGTSISNLLDPAAIRKRQATVRTEEWKNSDAAKSQKDALLKAARGPKKFGAWNARLDALFKTKQVRERVAADPQTLTTIGPHSQQRLKNLRSDPKARIISYLKSRVIWYSKTYPRGFDSRAMVGFKATLFHTTQLTIQQSYSMGVGANKRERISRVESVSFFLKSQSLRWRGRG